MNDAIANSKVSTEFAKSRISIVIYFTKVALISAVLDAPTVTKPMPLKDVKQGGIHIEGPDLKDM